MDTTTLIILGVIILIALYLFNRNRVQPRGTYDDKDSRSSGSIGGSPAYDDEDYRSGGSIGGSSQTDYDSPDYDSTGSIGGQQRTVNNTPVNRSSKPVNSGTEQPQHNSSDFKSGGSIGGSSSSGSSVRNSSPTPTNRGSQSGSSSSGSKPSLRGRDAKRKQ
jgi:hypothetical protein